MRHAFRIAGEAFRIRPIEDKDAKFVVELRTSAGRSRHMNQISPSVDAQRKWLSEYYNRQDDYYFVIEKLANEKPEGLISLYDVSTTTGSAEWGRWIITPFSLSAAESVLLIMDFAFNYLSLRSVYSYTAVGNASVNSFHDSCGFRRVAVDIGRFTIKNQSIDAVRHECDAGEWCAIRPALAAKCHKIAQRIHSYDTRL